MFPGIADRMQKELTALASSGVKVLSFFFIFALLRLFFFFPELEV